MFMRLLEHPAVARKIDRCQKELEQSVDEGAETGDETNAFECP